GGDLGFFAKNAVDKTIAETAFALEPGEISQPVQMGDDWIVVKTEQRRKTPQPKLEDIRADIISYMSYDEIEKLLQSLRNQSQIKLKLAPEAPQGKNGQGQEP
ncbi:MAG TPA: hypothetical protein ENJ42_03650, partial [Hellea balneolensis]|nr:hypothetical protein [Hellea balneolensis]